MRDFGIDRSVLGNEGTVGVASAFEGFLGFMFDARRVVLGAEFFGAIVAIFLEPMELAREPAENVDGGGEFVGVGGELFADVLLEEKLGELSGDELESDFRKL